MRTETKQVSKQREVPGGFLGLSRRVETFLVPQAETVTEDYWILEQRYWVKHEKGRGSAADETTRSDIYYCLGIDGSLFVRVETREEVSPKTRPYFEHRNDPSTHAMTESDVVLFDFAPNHYRSDGRPRIDTNREPDQHRLRYHAKGVGLSVALKRLLERTS